MRNKRSIRKKRRKNKFGIYSLNQKEKDIIKNKLGNFFKDAYKIYDCFKNNKSDKIELVCDYDYGPNVLFRDGNNYIYVINEKLDNLSNIKNKYFFNKLCKISKKMETTNIGPKIIDCGTFCNYNFITTERYTTLSEYINNISDTKIIKPLITNIYNLIDKLFNTGYLNLNLGRFDILVEPTGFVKYTYFDNIHIIPKNKENICKKLIKMHYSYYLYNLFNKNVNKIHFIIDDQINLDEDICDHECKDNITKLNNYYSFFISDRYKYIVKNIKIMNDIVYNILLTITIINKELDPSSFLIKLNQFFKQENVANT